MSLQTMNFGDFEPKETTEERPERKARESQCEKKQSEEKQSKEEQSNFSHNEVEEMQIFFNSSPKSESSVASTMSEDDSPVTFRDDSALRVTDLEKTDVAKKKPIGKVKPAKKHEYQAQEFVNIENEESEKPVVLLQGCGALRYTADYAKFGLVKTKFEHGELLLAKDRHGKPLMYLLESGGCLMAYRYLQGSLEVSIPASVDGMEVRYVHPQFLTGGFSPFKGVKFQALKEQFATENVLSVGKDSIKQSLKGVREVRLPNCLAMLPPMFFSHCLALKSIVIPESVSVVSCDTFAYSSFKEIVFNGPCPKGFKWNVDLPKGVSVKFRKKYANSFVGR